MLLKFLRSQSSNFLLISLCVIHASAFSFVGELGTLLKAERNRFFEKNNFLNYTPALKKEIQESKSISLDQDFLLSTLLRVSPSHDKFLNTQSECSLYSYFLSGLAQNALGEVRNIAINYTHEKKRKSSIISLRDFYDVIAKVNCPNTLLISELTNLKSYRESLDQIIELTPQEAGSCQEDFQEILFHPQVFNICSIYQQTKESRSKLSVFKLKNRFLNKVENSFDQQDRFFLENLCLTNKGPKGFCRDIFQADYWQKISQGKESPHITPIYCGIANKDLKTCLRLQSEEKQRCHYPKYLSSALVPAMNCQNISLAMNYSHLNTKYPECPLQLENSGLVASSRLLSHIKQSQYPVKPDSCVSYPLSLFTDFNFEFGNALAWKYELCYFDKIEQADKCFPSLIGSLPESPYSQEKVITKILRKNSILNQSQGCEAIEEESYNPNLLKYKSGCYILNEFSSCSLFECKFKVIYNEKELSLIKVNPAGDFSYISSSRDYRSFSQVNLITEQLKKSHNEIRNLSVLKTFFKNHPKSIIHGVGCAESLLPSFFRGRSLNQCEPVPFFIDGVIQTDNESLLVTRTTLDHLHAPRLISWQRVYSAVKTLHDIHPQKAWSLYGLH